MESKEIKAKAQNLLLKNGIGVFVGEEKVLRILQEIMDNEITPDDIDITLKTV